MSRRLTKLITVDVSVQYSHVIPFGDNLIPVCTKCYVSLAKIHGT